MRTIKLEKRIAENVFRDVVNNLQKFGFERTDFPESVIRKSRGKSDYHKIKKSRFVMDAREYQAEEHEFYNHRFNKEDFRQGEYILYRVDESGRVPVLIARNYVSWQTSVQYSSDEPLLSIQTISIEEDFATKGIEQIVA
jgi:hypothetical protein